MGRIIQSAWRPLEQKFALQKSNFYDWTMQILNSSSDWRERALKFLESETNRGPFDSYRVNASQFTEGKQDGSIV